MVVVAVNYVKKYLDSERSAEMNGKEWEESNFIEEETGRSRKKIFKEMADVSVNMINTSSSVIK